MAIQSVAPFAMPGWLIQPGSATFTSGLTIDAASEAVGFAFRAPRAGTIAAIGWGTRTVTTGATVDVRLETQSSGVPSGTLAGANANGAQVVNAADDNVSFLTSLTAGCEVTAGQRLAVVIQNPASSYGNMVIGAFYFAAALPVEPKSLLYTGSWARDINRVPIFWLLYSDAPYVVAVPGVFPIAAALTKSAIGTGSTPDVMGLRFQLPASLRICGVHVAAEWDGDANIRLVTAAYHQANGTGILDSTEVLAVEDLTTDVSLGYYPLAARPTLDASTWYRLVIEPSSATALGVLDFDLRDENAMGAWAGPNFHLTAAKDPTGDGDWTNYNSGTFRVPWIWPVFDGIDVSAGGGGRPEFRGGNL